MTAITDGPGKTCAAAQHRAAEAAPAGRSTLLTFAAPVSQSALLHMRLTDALMATKSIRGKKPGTPR
jgi:hypothetical protein